MNKLWNLTPAGLYVVYLVLVGEAMHTSTDLLIGFACGSALCYSHLRRAVDLD